MLNDPWGDVLSCGSLVASAILERHAGLQKLVAATPELARRPEFAAVRKLKAIDVVSTRLWFDRRINFRYPANVLAGFENHAGGTFFDLNVLQAMAPPHQQSRPAFPWHHISRFQCWHIDPLVVQDEYRDEAGSIVGADFYGATELLGLSDEEIVRKAVRNITRCEPALKGANVFP